jgi:hypothetical protein
VSTEAKREVTVWIEPSVFAGALGYARVNELDLSEVIEEALRDKIGEQTYPSFSEYWRGKFKVGTGTDQELLDVSHEPRYQHLMQKYLSLDSETNVPD